ncbi:MAG: tyrosine-type recombinase/integrase, partial [Burkholderiales bacterium]|nr:tyrosine-type recombinase/integrase [Burkholderiales bacterium]
MASFSKRGDQTLAQVRVKRGGVVVFSQSQVFAVVDFATRRRNLDKVSPATILSNLSPLSAAVRARDSRRPDRDRHRASSRTTASRSRPRERVRDRIAETGMSDIKDLRFHDLRHTGITMLFWRGLRVEEVAIVSGHTNWAQLKRYTHIKPEELHRHFPTPQELKQVEKDVVR